MKRCSQVPDVGEVGRIGENGFVHAPLVGEFLLRALARSDVARHAYPLDDLAGGIEHRHRARVRPANGAIGPEYAMLALEHALAHRWRPRIARSTRSRSSGKTYCSNQSRFGSGEASMNMRPSSCRSSRKSALMRNTTSELAVTSARNRASLSAECLLRNHRSLPTRPTCGAYRMQHRTGAMGKSRRSPTCFRFLPLTRDQAPGNGGVARRCYRVLCLGESS